MKVSERLLVNLKKETDFIIKKYIKIIKAVWVITPDEILSNDDLTMIMLIDDSIAKKSTIKKIEGDCYNFEQEIKKKENISIHSGVYLLSEYFDMIMENDPSIYREIGSSIPIYDPTSFFVPLKKMVEKGIIPGSVKSLDNLKNSVQKRFKEINRLKIQIVELLSLAAISAGQAMLIIKGSPIPHQRMVDEELIKCFKGDKKMPVYYAKMIEEVFEFQKEIEHGKIKEVNGQDIDNLFIKTKNVYEKTEELVSSLNLKEDKNE